MSTVPPRAIRNNLAALKSANKRQAERITLLEGLVQATNTERDLYLQRATELEQLVCAIDGALTGLRLRYEARDREKFSGESVSALDAVRECIAAFEKAVAEDTNREAAA